MRRNSREIAFKLLFEELVSGSVNPISYESFSHTLTGDDDKDFLNEILQIEAKEKEFIRSVVKRYAVGYSPERIYKVDLAILTVAIAEILFIPSVPDKVSVNEAVELAKLYSTDNSPSFINGLLASVIRDKEGIINERNAD